MDLLANGCVTKEWSNVGSLTKERLTAEHPFRNREIFSKTHTQKVKQTKELLRKSRQLILIGKIM